MNFKIISKNPKDCREGFSVPFAIRLSVPSKSLRDSPSPPLEDTTKISFSYGFRRNKFLIHPLHHSPTNHI